MQGQLWGGPQHGNFVETTVESFLYSSIEKMWLDGHRCMPSIRKVEGRYTWSEEDGIFKWEGPGADGDTIERLRLQ